jgi:hypothetical protein
VTEDCLLWPQRKFEAYAFGLLQGREDAGKIRGRRAAFRPHHSHQAFGGNVCAFLETLKADGRVDIVPQNGFADREVAVEDALDSLPQ